MESHNISKWLTFEKVSGINICGGGLIDGRGKKWWDANCRYHPGQKVYILVYILYVPFVRSACAGMSGVTCISSHILQFESN